MQMMTIDSHEDVLELLKVIAKMITTMFGNHCEVAISDLMSEQKNVIWIENGSVTNREIGSPLTKDARERMLQMEEGLFINYPKVFNQNTKEIKSSTAIFKIKEKMYSFCINYDITMEKDMAYHLQSFISMMPNIIEKSEVPDANKAVIQEMAESELIRLGIPASKLSKDDRIGIVKRLNNQGVFSRQNSVPFVAEILEVSRYTIYNDLKNIDED